MMTPVELPAAGDRVVGRDADVRFLTACLDRAAQGSGGLVRITGAPGIGKTALASTLVDRARAAGIDVAWASCWRSAVVPALWPWTQLLSQLPPSGAGEPPALAPPEHLDVDTARAVQADRVARWLRERDRTALLVLDDLQWADAGTLAVLVHVSAVLPVASVLVVATARDPDQADSAYADLLAQPSGLGDEVALVGLDRESCASLLGAVSGVAPNDEVAGAVHALTRGNPLFLREVARGLPAGRAGSLDTESLGRERSVSEVVDARLATMSIACRAVLATLAVTGDEVPLPLLASACGLERGDLVDAVSEAESAGLVVHDETLRFAHDVFRVAVLDGLTLSERTHRHDEVGRALLLQRAAGEVVDAAALAHHFGRSAMLGNAGPAHDYALEAARDATSMMAFDVATKRFEQALVAIGVDETVGARHGVRLELADTLVAAGRFDDARAAFALAATEARAAGDARSFGRAALGFSGGVAGIEVVVADPEVCDLLREATLLLADDDVVGALVQARLSVALTFLAPVDERRRLAEEALARARATRDPATLAQSLASWCDVVAGPAYVVERRSAAAEVVELAVRCRDARVEALGRRLLVEALMEAGDLPGADAEITRFERTGSRLGRPEYRWWPVLWRASLALARGDAEEHAHRVAELEVAAEYAGGTNAPLLAEVHRIASAFDLDDGTRARASFDVLVAMDVPIIDVQIRITVERIRVVLDGHGGSPVDLGGLVDEALTTEVDSEWLPMMVQLAELAVLGRDVEAAARMRAVLEPFAEVWAVEGIGAGIRGPVHRWLAPLAQVCGDDEAAARHTVRARAATSGAGAHLLTAIIDGDRAVLLPFLTDVPVVQENWFVRDGESWSLSYAGVSVTLRDSKGIRDLARLLSEPGRELAALDLVAEGPTLQESGTGETLDAQARAAYTARLQELEEDLADADLDGDADRSARLADEREMLVEQLTSAYGLGGRAREGGRSAERARTAVRARIRDALRRIEEVHPGLGRHLTRSVRTGVFCAYDPAEPVSWRL